MPAAPRRASATAWSATSPSECPARRGAPGISIPPSRSGVPGPNGWLSCPKPTRTASGASACSTRTEIGRQRHLEVRGFTGDRMDRDHTGLEQGGLVRELARPVRREGQPGVEEQPPTRALRCLGGGERGAVHRLQDEALVQPLERLRDREDRDRRSVDRNRLCDRHHERLRDERPRPVMHEQGALGVTRIEVLDASHAGRDRFLAGGPAADDGVHPRWQPVRPGHLGDAPRRGHEDQPLEDGRGGDCIQRPREERPTADRRHQLVRPTHPLRGPGRDDHDVRPQAPVVLLRHPSRCGAGRRSCAPPRSAGRA